MFLRRRFDLSHLLSISSTRYFIYTLTETSLLTSCFIKLPWVEVRKEMTEEKGLDPTSADRIGEYVKNKGVHYLEIPFNIEI